MQKPQTALPVDKIAYDPNWSHIKATVMTDAAQPRPNAAPEIPLTASRGLDPREAAFSLGQPLIHESPCGKGMIEESPDGSTTFHPYLTPEEEAAFNAECKAALQD